ncbi:MAG: DUF523 domain-containing protein [Verrucomicrobiae bacterium]|nr:DUF523 domain-containing protein [Verrucomicrobiae bacterium]
MKEAPYIVSACLAGVNCRHDGGNRLDRRVARLVAEGRAIPVCPEQLGGRPTPRAASNLAGGTGADVLDGRACVVDVTGRDVTAEFIRGARETLLIARTAGATRAILKENSPSCGVKRTYLLDASGRPGRVEGQGVTTALLSREGVRVISEDEL